MPTPQCQHRNKTFKRYIDLETNDYLADHVGRCDREDRCGYHYTPRQYFAENPGNKRATKVSVNKPVKNYFSQIDVRLLNESTHPKYHRHNNFLLFLRQIFTPMQALQASEDYRIGTSKHWPGATVFWQIDSKGKARTGKIMLYDKNTAKRVKQPFNHIAWVHTVIENSNSKNPIKSEIRNPTSEFQLRQCFFGEHLLNKRPEATVGITESEKTAVMASIMMPNLVWLAAGSKNGLDVQKCQALKHRTVLLFPDVGAYDYWTECARTLKAKIPTATFTVHHEMELTATDEERATGADMADRWIAEWGELTTT